MGHKPPRERIQYSTWNPGPSFPTRARSKKTLFVKLFIAVMGEADRQEALVGTWEREWDPPPLPAALPATLLVCLPSAPACLPRNASVHMIQFFLRDPRGSPTTFSSSPPPPLPGSDHSLPVNAPPLNNALSPESDPNSTQGSLTDRVCRPTTWSRSIETEREQRRESCRDCPRQRPPAPAWRRCWWCCCSSQSCRAPVVPTLGRSTAGRWCSPGRPQEYLPAIPSTR